MPPLQTSPSVLCILALATGALAAPCDIYASGNTPCVAAHSTTRALYQNYNGPLYRLARTSDGNNADVSTIGAGGIANSAQQDTFCSDTNCTIILLYDQSGNSNHLSNYQGAADATRAPVQIMGQRVYGLSTSPGEGYNNDQTTGVATGDEPEGMYAVLDGTRYNQNCCFDYGNAETNTRNNGNAHMEAIYFGNNTIWGSGAGDGPWIMADMENGLFAGVDFQKSTSDPSITSRFVTAIVKGASNLFSIRGADATTGTLSTYYSGVRPDGYNPMQKEGAIILGTGGDGSSGAQGTFYEGVMTSGYPSDSTEAAVQEDIVAARYTL